MKADIRLIGSAYAAAIADLSRPHPFAVERVGFFSVALGKLAPDRMLLLGHRYTAVPDAHYLDDPRAGACIGPEAIRAAMQRILDTGEGQLHVHLHDHFGRPRPSRTDLHDMPALVKSLNVVGPACAHGAIILSNDRAWAQVTVPESRQLFEVTAVTVAGFPLLFLNR